MTAIPDFVGRETVLFRRLLECTRLLTSTLDLKELTTRVLNIIRDEVGFDRGSVFIVDHDAGLLRSFVAQDIGNSEICVPIGTGIAGAVAVNGELLDIPAASHDKRFCAIFDNVLRFKTEDIYCMPIRNTQDACIGVLQLLNRRRALTSGDKQLLYWITMQLGCTLENAWHHFQLQEKHRAELEISEGLRRANRQLQGLVFRDALTGLNNFRYFEVAIERELARSQRYSRPVSLILFDMDDFKRINDDHGHQYGDLVLRRIAQTINRSSRKTDIVARYGGEEFAVILPDTDLKGALVKAENCRRTIEALTTRAGSAVIQVTVSAGVAVNNPSRPINKDHLIQAADVALYSSKKTGRNRVTCVESV
jgi:diguanylate cyclase (GGDEF)-like protein